MPCVRELFARACTGFAVKLRTCPRTEGVKSAEERARTRTDHGRWIFIGRFASRKYKQAFLRDNGCDVCRVPSKLGPGRKDRTRPSSNDACQKSPPPEEGGEEGLNSSVRDNV